MRAYQFAKRNFKEIVRDPLSIIFCICFPILMLMLFQIIVWGIGVENLEFTPQFKIQNLTGAVITFGYTFIMLFLCLLVSKDRTTAFLTRLKCSPMKNYEFLLGYALPMLPIALIQTLLTLCVSFIFGLGFSWNLLLYIISFIPAILFFVAVGLLVGSVFNDKVCGGICSLIINVVAFLGGMFMPLDNMNNALVTIANIFPFAPLLKFSACCLSGDFSSMALTHFLSIGIWLPVVIGSAIILFTLKLKRDKKG